MLLPFVASRAWPFGHLSDSEGCRWRAASADLHLIQFILHRVVLRAFCAVEIAHAGACHLHVLTHVDAPRVVTVAAQEAIGADFNTV